MKTSDLSNEKLKGTRVSVRATESLLATRFALRGTRLELERNLQNIQAAEKANNLKLAVIEKKLAMGADLR